MPNDSHKTKLRINFDKTSIIINCEWNSCHYTCDKLKNLQEHLINHLRDVYCASIENTLLACGICNFKLQSDLSAVRHMYYHAYHLYLKSRGRYIINLYSLNQCTYESCSANDIPSFEHSFLCRWEGCDYSSQNISEFYDHIDFHPVAMADAEDINQECKWSNCSFVARTRKMLQIHLTTHCERRYIACPTCGVCFASTSKFRDHLKRQIVTTWNKDMHEREMSEVFATLANNPVIPLPKPIVPSPDDAFKCNLCMHLFATKALLKDHESRHLLKWPCNHCTKICPTRYALKRHILFCHTEEKPYRCEKCDAGFKCSDGLKRHMQSIHGGPVGQIQCSMPDCQFLAKSLRSLNIHMTRKHCKLQAIITKVFVCHLCGHEYIKGNHLSKHLCKVHNINKATTYGRHQFKISPDGKYRLNVLDLQLKTPINDYTASSKD